jgi:hypothetical protein
MLKPHGTLLVALLAAVVAPVTLPIIGPEDLGASGLDQASEKTVTFGFAPPHRTTFVEVTRIEKELQIQPGQPPERQITEMRGSYLIDRMGSGYLVSMKPIRPKDIVLSDKAEQMAQDLLSRLDVQYELDSAGRLLKVHGVESGLRWMTDAMGKKLADAWIKSFGWNSLNQWAISQWNNRGLLGMFAGQTVPVGREQTMDGPIPLPIGGSVSGNVRMVVQGPIPCGGRTCYAVRIKMRSADPEVGLRITTMMNDLIAGALGAAGADEAAMARVPKVGYTTAELTVESERVMEAITGLPHSDTTESVLAAVLVVQKENAPFRIVEKQTSRFEYQ